MPKVTMPSADEQEILKGFKEGDRVFLKSTQQHAVFNAYYNGQCWVQHEEIDGLSSSRSANLTDLKLCHCKASIPKDNIKLFPCFQEWAAGSVVSNLPDLLTNSELPNLSSLPNIPEKSSPKTSLESQSGTMYELLQQSLEILTLFVQARHASHFPPPESSKGLATTEICSPNFLDCYAEFNQDGRLLKTSQTYSILMLDGTFEEYSGNLPRAGMMCSGKLYPAPKWEESIGEKGSGLLPTPKAQDGEHPGVQAHKKGQTLHLSAAVQNLPTPTARDWKHGSAAQLMNLRSPNLNDTMAAVTGNKKLNPIFVERLMGFQENETALTITSLDTQTSPNGLTEPQITIPSPTEKNGSKLWAMQLPQIKLLSSGEGLQELSIDEDRDRHDLERKVENAFIKAESVFREAVFALKEIRDRKLYRSSNATFEEYCKERFGFSRRRPYQLIDAAVVLENLANPDLQMCTKTEIGTHLLPNNERQIRDLVDLSPEEQVKVWGKATSDGKIPSGDKIKDTLDAHIREHLGKPPIPTYYEGDVVEIRSGGHSSLREHDGMWGIVTEVLPSRYKIYISLRNTEVRCKGDELEKVKADAAGMAEIISVGKRASTLLKTSDKLSHSAIAVLDTLGRQTCFSPDDLWLLEQIEQRFQVKNDTIEV